MEKAIFMFKEERSFNPILILTYMTLATNKGLVAVGYFSLDDPRSLQDPKNRPCLCGYGSSYVRMPPGGITLAVLILSQWLSWKELILIPLCLDVLYA